VSEQDSSHAEIAMARAVPRLGSNQRLLVTPHICRSSQGNKTITIDQLTSADLCMMWL